VGDGVPICDAFYDSLYSYTSIVAPVFVCFVVFLRSLSSTCPAIHSLPPHLFLPSPPPPTKETEMPTQLTLHIHSTSLAFLNHYTALLNTAPHSQIQTIYAQHAGMIYNGHVATSQTQIEQFVKRKMVGWKREVQGWEGLPVMCKKNHTNTGGGSEY